MVRKSASSAAVVRILIGGVAGYLVYLLAGLLWGVGAFLLVVLLTAVVLRRLTASAVEARYRTALRRWNDSYLCLRCGERAVVGPAGDALVADSGKAEVDALLAQGRKIEAIKVLREETGLGLAEAKEQVEARARDLGL